MTATHKKKSAISAEGGLRGLIEGNDRFMHGAARFPTICKETLADHARGQQPYATILGCSDSRVPPELIFDANFGELFYRARCGERNVARGHGKSAVRCLVKELGTREVPDVAATSVIASRSQHFSVGQQDCSVVGTPGIKLPVAPNVPLEGLYSSALAKCAPPPAIST